jgi:hypothetical protein
MLTLKKIKAALTGKCCHQYSGNSYLWDFHRGGDGELYVRTAVRCTQCEHEKRSATRLPDEVTNLIDASALPIFTMGAGRNDNS